jgi:HemY protein
MAIFHGSRFFLKLAIISGLSVLMGLYPGHFTVEWLGYRGTMPIALLLVILFSCVSLLIFLHHCWRYVLHIPGHTRLFFRKKRQRKFDDVLLEGFTALAAQQIDEAQNCADLAKSLSPHHPLSLFLLGQASFMNKNHALAHTVYTEMVDIPSLRFLGFRGLTHIAYAQNDWKRAHHFLEKMYEIRPDSVWVLEQLEMNALKLMMMNPDQSLDQPLIFYKHLPKSTALHHHGLMLWIKYIHEKERETLSLADKLNIIQEAHHKVPENIIIARAYADALKQTQHIHKAAKVLSRTYKHKPHRLLGEAWLNIYAETEPLDGYQKIEKLTSMCPDHHESAWLCARAAINAQLWGPARHHMNVLLDGTVTKSTYALMIELEKREYPNGSDAIAVWEEKIKTSTHEWKWLCTHCGYHMVEWDVMCQKCGHFGTYSWEKVNTETTYALHTPMRIGHTDKDDIV